MPNPRQSKISKVQAMLQRPAGATLDAICKTTGWQAHSARAALSGLRKAGHQIDRADGDGSSSSVYRIIGTTGARS
jgi:hypothetical protein